MLFSNSAIKAYRNIDMTRERTSFTFDPRDILLTRHISFSFVRAALERASGYDICAVCHLGLHRLLSAIHAMTNCFWNQSDELFFHSDLYILDVYRLNVFANPKVKSRPARSRYIIPERGK